jgi:replicative DNA helicase
MPLVVERMPADEAAEKAVLGEILNDNAAYADAAALLIPDDFADESNRRIFTQIIELIETGNTADIVSVSSRLGDHKQLEAIGGVAYLSDLDRFSLRGHSVVTNCRTIRDKSKRRQLMRACEVGYLAASDSAETTAEVLSIVEDRLLELRGNEHGKTLHHVSEVMPEVIQQLEDEAKGLNQSGLAYGLTTLDGAIGHMRPGELIVVGALPGRGKTAFSAQILSANAQETPSMDFSIEMTRWQLGKRLLAANSTVSASRIQHPEFINDGWPLVKGAAKAMESWKLWFDDSSSITLNELTSRGRLAIRKHGVRLIVVDYLRLVRTKGKDTREKVGNVCDGLRQLAKAEQVTIVLLSQLSRPGDINERPTMLNLKESGDIEAHAHVVLLLYTPEDKQGQPTGEDEIIIGKCREGTRGPVPVFLHKSRLQFVPRVVNQ